MSLNWLEPEEIDIPPDYVAAIGGNPLVSRILFSRGYTDMGDASAFLSPEEYHPTPPAELPGLSAAVSLLVEALNAQKTIGVWGDFDVDGQTSTTILVSALRQMGGKVIYHIPVRAAESHGISLPALQKFIRHGVEVVLTCDTGISSHEPIAYASQQGVPVIVTDHHDLPASLPQAAAVVNPKLLPAGHPLALLPGVGVAYKIAEALFEQDGGQPAASQYLDLVALGIVADIALLKDENRYLLQLGLQALRNTRRVGLLAIMELAELNQANLTEEHIGYILAPRMNALGRLDDANSMVELLTTTDRGRARLLALELEGMNAQRKLLSDQVFQAALAQLDNDPQLLELPVLVLSHPSWPAGVIGIVASRLVEQYHRPAILFSAPAGQQARGSARSVEGLNITSAIAANQSLVLSYGGHPMAAGLAVEAERIPDFRLAIGRTVREMESQVHVEKGLRVDSYLSLSDLSLDLVADMERLSPFGAGNPPLVFATRDLKLTGYAAIGRSGEHLQLNLEDELGHTHQSIWWQGAGYPLPQSKFDLAYSVRTSTYRGQRDVQIEWIDYRQVESLSAPESPPRRPIEVTDLRSEAKPLSKLNELAEHLSLVTWGEAHTSRPSFCVDRLSLHPADYLAIWTIPPGPVELQSVLRLVQPTRIYLFAINPGMDSPKEFLNRLAGLIKNSLKSHQGIAHLTALAAATAQKVATVKTGLDWLDDQGIISVVSINDDEVKIEPGTGRKKGDTKTSSTHLNSLLAESAAYRRYYRTARCEGLVALEEDTQ
jgi:single-stranded-DNA-specific exonuclease